MKIFNIYKNTNLKIEVLAGLTVALALIPEAVAFAFVAGVEPLVGLYAAFTVGLITSIFGGRPGMISGATGAIAVVLAPLVKMHGVEYLFACVILMGVLQIIFGWLKLGKFSRMIPHPVMLGFVNGLAIIIFKAQLGQFKIDGQWMGGTTLIAMLALVFFTMAVIYYLPKLTKAIPSSLVAIALTTLISLYLRTFGINILTVADFAQGDIAGGFPKFHLPQIVLSFDLLKIIFPFAFIAALVGLIESLLTLTLIDEITDTRGKSNKESVGQGLANVVTGFFGGMGGCAMIGQSMINISSGSRKRLSGLIAAISLLGFVMFGSKLISIIPIAALVGVMFIVVIATFEWETLSLGKKIPFKDILVILIVTLITVFHDLALAVIIGIVVSALIFSWEKGKKISVETLVKKDGTKVYRLEGPLFFCSVASFKKLFDVKNDPENVIINFQKSFVRDHSAIEAINTITERYAAQNKSLQLKYLSKDCLKLLKNAEKIINVNIIEDPKYSVADNLLD